MSNLVEIKKLCHTYKLVLLGSSSVGKSSIAIRAVNGSFNETNEPTIGAAFFTKTIDTGDNVVKFEIWDTAGQERYLSLAPLYYRGANVIFIVYDSTNYESFKKCKFYKY